MLHNVNVQIFNGFAENLYTCRNYLRVTIATKWSELL